MPAQNTGPVAGQDRDAQVVVRIQACQASDRPHRTYAFTAFFFSGRLIVTVRM